MTKTFFLGGVDVFPGTCFPGTFLPKAVIQYLCDEDAFLITDITERRFPVDVFAVER